MPRSFRALEEMPGSFTDRNLSTFDTHSINKLTKSLLGVCTVELRSRAGTGLGATCARSDAHVMIFVCVVLCACACTSCLCACMRVFVRVCLCALLLLCTLVARPNPLKVAEDRGALAVSNCVSGTPEPMNNVIEVQYRVASRKFATKLQGKKHGNRRVRNQNTQLHKCPPSSADRVRAWEVDIEPSSVLAAPGAAPADCERGVFWGSPSV